MKSSLPWFLVALLRDGVAARRLPVRRLTVIGLFATCALLIPVLAAWAADANQALQRQVSCKLAWTVDLRPRSTLTAVEVGSRGVWVTGGGGVVFHRNGKRWSSTTIRGVDAIVDIASDRAAVWAVGVRRNRSGDPTGDYVFRWTGKRWQRVRIPGLPTARRGLEFSAVTIVAGDVWLAGSYDDTHSERTMGAGGWVTARLHGSHWQVFSGGNGYTGLTAIAGVDARDAWGVGGQGPTMASAQELMLHWTGSKWIDSSRYDYVYRLNDVLTLTRDDAWAVGETNLDAFPQDARRPAIEHWNGKQWLRVAVPAWRRPTAPSLHSLAAFGRQDVWAGGERAGGAPVLLHWDGAQWQDAIPPPVATGIEDFAAATDGSLWAVGRHFVARARCK